MQVVLDYVCTGRVRKRLMQGRLLSSAIGKVPVVGAVSVGPLGLVGDEQEDLSVHGGLSKALYAWPVQHTAWWNATRTERVEDAAARLDHPISPGGIGENLGLRGLAQPLCETEIFVGDELHFAHAVLRVTEARQPCFKFNAVLGYEQAAKDMVLSGRCGFYVSVVLPGLLCAGDTATLVPGPRAFSIAQALQGKRYKHLR